MSSQKSSQATARAQFVSYKLRDSGLLSLAELGLLSYIEKNSVYCAPKSLELLATKLRTSIRTLRRLINGLVEKGIIVRKYLTFKKLWLQIVPIERQTEILTRLGIIGHDRADTSDRPNCTHHDRPNCTHHDRPNCTYPIKSKTLREKTIETTTTTEAAVSETDAGSSSSFFLQVGKKSVTLPAAIATCDYPKRPQDFAWLLKRPNVTPESFTESITGFLYDLEKGFVKSHSLDPWTVFFGTVKNGAIYRSRAPRIVNAAPSRVDVTPNLPKPHSTTPLHKNLGAKNALEALKLALQGQYRAAP